MHIWRAVVAMLNPTHIWNMQVGGAGSLVFGDEHLDR